MVFIQFQIINYWSQPKLKDCFEQPVEEISAKAVIDYWKSSTKNHLQGGYCISNGGEPWNGYRVKSKTYYMIDHLGGACSFLNAITLLKNNQTLPPNSIWQVDQSSMSLERQEDKIILKDIAYEFQNITLNWHSFLLEFTKATQAFVDFQEKLLLKLQEEAVQNTLFQKTHANWNSDLEFYWKPLLEKLKT